MPTKVANPTAEAVAVMTNCSFEVQCATWLMQDGWQVFTPLLDHGHKVDLLVSDGRFYFPIQVKAIESVSEHVEIHNKWKRSAVRLVIYFARNSNWGYVIPAFQTNRKWLDEAGGERFQQTKNSFLRAFHLVPAAPPSTPVPTVSTPVNVSAGVTVGG